MTTTATPSPLKRRGAIAAAVVAAFAFGLLVRGDAPVSDSANPAGARDAPASMPTEHAHDAPNAPDFWTCAMHPQIRLPEPGRCPICAMELIPYYSEGGATDAPRQLVMSPAARELARIQTTPVVRQAVARTVRMVGKITYDETRLGYITARFPGRIDKLYVDYTGVTVRKGDHLAELYSPALISAQEELFQALAAAERLERSDLDIMRTTAASTVDAARNKLRLWDLTADQIAEIERRGTVQEHVTIFSPMAGIVIHRNATEGMYVETGARIYTIARLDLVWVMLEAYESDIAWLRYGQDVQFTTESYPGETFHGRIAFIDPVLNPTTRTIQVRVNVENADGRLKPNMFVRATVQSALAAGGLVVDPSLAGKWIGPMHPEIVRDEPGQCPICGMDLVRPEDIGLVPALPSHEAPLVIPASAPLVTGKRAVVYVQLAETDRPTFEGREVTLGPRTGDYYIVLEGLREGEAVVTQGNFKIDSALQIQAKPSMMNPEGGVAPAGHAGHGAPPAAAPAASPASAPASAPATHAPPASAPTADAPPAGAHAHE